jgi:GT2 family glycosyltransferase
MSTTSAVIVNYRTASLTIGCLRSLATAVVGHALCRVVVVDNGSADGSAERIAEAIRTEGWHAWAELLPLADNRGFAAGNNAALRLLLEDPAPPDYVWLLNPDTVVQPGALQPLVEFLETHPDVGMVGSRLENPDGTSQRSAFRFHSIASELERGIRLGLVSRLLRRYVLAPPVQDQTHRADWVSGASMLVRRSVFDSIGLFDEGYFLYFEETDFCLEARRAGWSCWYVPQSRVVHLVGQSTGIQVDAPKRRRVPVYWFQSRHRYLTKNHGSLRRLVSDFAWLFGFLCWRVRRRLQRKPDNDPPGLLWDFIRFGLLHRDGRADRQKKQHASLSTPLTRIHGHG